MKEISSFRTYVPLGEVRGEEGLSAGLAKSYDSLDARTSLAVKSLVMRPHPDDLYDLDVFKDLIDEAVLDIDTAGISTRQISH